MRFVAERVALVTGAGSGIGRASAVSLAEAGFTLVLAGRTNASLVETAALLPTPALCIVADVACEADVDRLFGEIERRFGRLDLLFNNAGIAGGGPIETLALKVWNEVVAINLTGTFLCARAAFRLMKRQSPQGGRIINNGSISAHAPRPNSIAYTATKHAITGITKSLSLDGRAYDIACCQIDIGNAATPLAERMARGVPQADGSIAVEPTMPVDEVGRAVAYMASLPPGANVQFMTVMATKMPFVGRG
jgi:NAD(P)-dependent dehydrogenase (short-subunit alcohol dehydrogenase family)